jgi:hypothetical protein
VLTTLAQAGYRGGLHVELPRQSHRWRETARQSARVLKKVSGLFSGHSVFGK